uniref:NADH-ubiquinone oxidoreductase chain 3 n=1 Tax=Limulus polyphemus TaxID=6850 RepID=K9S2R7_LIMPO|nr:NADH dehydrogenase subunit 3 [Limulus polyphemus]
MKSILTSIILSITLSFILIILSLTLSKKSTLDKEKSSPYECGFNPFSSSRIPFSLRFFLISIIFLIFDVEIALLLPIPLTTSLKNSMITLSIFLMILILGLFHEWNQGALEWAN